MGRGAGVSGPAPLSWRDLEAYRAVTGLKPPQERVRAVLIMDRAYLSEVLKRG